MTLDEDSAMLSMTSSGSERELTAAYQFSPSVSTKCRYLNCNFLLLVSLSKTLGGQTSLDCSMAKSRYFTTKDTSTMKRMGLLSRIVRAERIIPTGRSTCRRGL